LITAALVAWFACGWGGLTALLVASAATGAIVLFVLRRLPGLTGDIYGAICEILELLVLLTLIVEARYAA
jgi:cobalamin synthase